MFSSRPATDRSSKPKAISTVTRAPSAGSSICCRVLEREYLLPIYQRLIIDAPDIATACRKAVENDDWESAEEDGDGSGATTINVAREIPEGLIEQIERGNIHAGSFLWEDRPNMGRVWTFPNNTNDLSLVSTCCSVSGRGVGAVRPSRSCREPLAGTDLRSSARPTSESVRREGPAFGPV